MKKKGYNLKFRIKMKHLWEDEDGLHQANITSVYEGDTADDAIEEAKGVIAAMMESHRPNCPIETKRTSVTQYDSESGKLLDSFHNIIA